MYNPVDCNDKTTVKVIAGIHVYYVTQRKDMRLYHRRKEMHELLANNNFNVPDYQLPSESELICVLKELI